MSISSHHSVSNYSANKQSHFNRDDITVDTNKQSHFNRDGITVDTNNQSNLDRNNNTNVANNQSDIDRDDITDIANSQSDIDRDDSKCNEYIIYNTDGFDNGNTIHPVYDYGSDGGD